MLEKKLPPCALCPYKRGLIKTFINPCPGCKAGGYKEFERLKKRLEKGTADSKTKQ